MSTPALRPSPLHLTLSLLLPLLACAGGQKPAPAPAAAEPGLQPTDYFPLAVGNSWTYDVRGAGKSSADTIRIVGQDGPWYVHDHGGRVRLDSDGVRDADRYLLKSPLAPGKEWSAVDHMVVQSFAVLSVDAQVTVPAGRYEKCVVVRNDQSLQGGGHLITDWSYAPGVGLILVTTRTQLQGKEQERTRVQLVRFEREH